MKRFHGVVGFAETVKTKPGVYEERIVERSYYGNIVRNSRTLLEGEKVNNDISVSNSISIVADPYAREHFFTIRYVRWAGARWRVTEVTEERPRLILRLGEVYNGNAPTIPETP